MGDNTLAPSELQSGQPVSSQMRLVGYQDGDFHDCNADPQPDPMTKAPRTITLKIIAASQGERWRGHAEVPRQIPVIAHLRKLKLSNGSAISIFSLPFVFNLRLRRE